MDNNDREKDDFQSKYVVLLLVIIVTNIYIIANEFIIEGRSRQMWHGLWTHNEVFHTRDQTPQKIKKFRSSW